MYARGRPLTTHSQLLLRQAELVSNTRKHLDVVRKMYQLRFSDEDISRLTMQLGTRGQPCAAGIPQSFQGYRCSVERPTVPPGGFCIGRCRQSGAFCRARLFVRSGARGDRGIGLRPGLGFVHVGHECSFVYDIADLYKVEGDHSHRSEVAAQAPDDLLP